MHARDYIDLPSQSVRMELGGPTPEAIGEPCAITPQIGRDAARGFKRRRFRRLIRKHTSNAHIKQYDAQQYCL